MKTTETRLKFSQIALCLATILSLGGCGGTGQDDGEVNDAVLNAKGLSIDGYLARATIFIDSNNNATRDPWEPWAFTDNDGFYSVNPKTGVNYCAASATEQEQEYCLTSNIDYGEVVLRIDGGYDVTTGEPFLGQLSRRVNLATGVVDVVISPITSLLTNVDQTDQATLMGAMKLDESDLNVDYLDTDGAGGVNAKLLNTAVTIHKVVTVMSDKIEDNYTEIGETIGTANDASGAVYTALANTIVDAVANAEEPESVELDTVVSDPDTLVQVMDAAEEEVKETYEQKDLDLPPDMGSPDNPDGLAATATVASAIPAVVDSVIDEEATDMTAESAGGGVKAVEAVVIKAVADDTNTDESVSAAITFFTDSNNSELVTALTQSLGSDTGDVTGLAANDFAGDDFDSAEEMTQASSFPADVKPFSVVGGQQLKMSVLDLGSRPMSADDKEYLFFFEGTETDRQGAFKACVKHVEGANENTGELGEGNTRGELVKGNWSLMNPKGENQESYSLLITITFLGTTYSGILKPSGMEMIGDEGAELEYTKIRFDNNGEILKVHSLNGFTEIETTPNSNQDCKTLLPSRLNI